MKNRELLFVLVLLLVGAFAGVQAQNGPKTAKKYQLTEQEKQKRVARTTLKRECLEKNQAEIDRKTKDLQNELHAKQIEEAKLLEKVNADDKYSTESLKNQLRSAEASGRNPDETRRIRKEIAAGAKRGRSNPELVKLRKEIQSLQKQISDIIRDELSKDAECRECLSETRK